MNLRQSSLAALVVLGLATHTAQAQAQAQPQQTSVPQEAVPQASVQQASVDISRLPIDVARIQRQLDRTREREYREGLNLRYIIDVFGQAPRIELFTKDDNLLNGPVPYGSPTHKEMIYMVTPQEFRAPVMDFGSLFRWLADKSKDKK